MYFRYGLFVIFHAIIVPNGTLPCDYWHASITLWVDWTISSCAGGFGLIRFCRCELSPPWKRVASLIGLTVPRLMKRCVCVCCCWCVCWAVFTQEIIRYNCYCLQLPKYSSVRRSVITVSHCILTVSPSTLIDHKICDNPRICIKTFVQQNNSKTPNNNVNAWHAKPLNAAAPKQTGHLDGSDQLEIEWCSFCHRP